MENHSTICQSQGEVIPINIGDYIGTFDVMEPETEKSRSNIGDSSNRFGDESRIPVNDNDASFTAYASTDSKHDESTPGKI